VNAEKDIEKHRESFRFPDNLFLTINHATLKKSVLLSKPPNGSYRQLFDCIPFVMAEKDIEKRREQYKRYLEEKRVMDTLSKLIVSIYEKPEKPPDALTYIRDFLALDTGGVDIISIRMENVVLTRKIAELTAKLADLHKKVAAHTRPETPESGGDSPE
jgi:hypothetical protein